MNIQEIYYSLSTEERVKFAKANRATLGIDHMGDFSGYTNKELFAELKKRDLYEIIAILESKGVSISRIRDWAETE